MAKARLDGSTQAPEGQPEQADGGDAKRHQGAPAAQDGGQPGQAPEDAARGAQGGALAEPAGHGSRFRMVGGAVGIVEALATHAWNLEATAQALEVSLKTLRRWLRLDSVKQARREAQQQQAANVLEPTWHRLERWMKKLDEMIDDPDLPASTKLQAIKVGAEFAAKAQASHAQLSELEDEIRKLKAQKRRHNHAKQHPRVAVRGGEAERPVLADQRHRVIDVEVIDDRSDRGADAGGPDPGPVPGGPDAIDI